MIDREREREREIYIYIYSICVYTYIALTQSQVKLRDDLSALHQDLAAALKEQSAAGLLSPLEKGGIMRKLDIQATELADLNTRFAAEKADAMQTYI